ncbi:hypothetical protein P4200_00060 [Pseudomonas aeruginosa]|nr:hypothetical protein [Pseudomonas aeruginosa]
MLDEATAAAEAMTFCKRLSKNCTSQAFFASRHCHPQTLDVLRTRAEPLGIEVVVGDERHRRLLRLLRRVAAIPHLRRRDRRLSRTWSAASMRSMRWSRWRRPAGADPADPAGRVRRRRGHRQRPALRRAARLRRSPHAAYFATRDAFKQADIAGTPGRRLHRPPRQAGHRLAMQTREQHIRRESHQQHLHRPGAAGQHRQHVRRLPRPAGPAAHRPAHPPADRDPRRRPGSAWAWPSSRSISSTP